MQQPTASPDRKQNGNYHDIDIDALSCACRLDQSLDCMHAICMYYFLNVVHNLFIFYHAASYRSMYFLFETWKCYLPWGVVKTNQSYCKVYL